MFLLSFVPRGQTVQFLLAIKWPAGFAMLTTDVGFWQTLPYMWIIMAASLVFMGIAVGICYIDHYKNSKSPLHKIQFTGTVARHELVALTTSSLFYSEFDINFPRI